MTKCRERQAGLRFEKYALHFALALSDELMIELASTPKKASQHDSKFDLSLSDASHGKQGVLGVESEDFDHKGADHLARRAESI